MKILLKETRPTTRRSKKRKDNEIIVGVGTKICTKVHPFIPFENNCHFFFDKMGSGSVYFGAKIQIVKVLFKRTEAAFLPTIKKI